MPFCACLYRLGALFANRLGPLANAFNKLNAFLSGPILGIFLLGMLTREAKAKPTIVGAGVGFAAVSWLNWNTDISFFYHAMIGTVVTFAVGYLLSLLGTAPRETELSGLVSGLQAPEPEGSGQTKA